MVTGGNRGLGHALVIALQAAGARVEVTGRSDQHNATVSAHLAGGRPAEQRSLADARAAKPFLFAGTIPLSFLPVQFARSALQHLDRRQRDCS